MKIRKVTSLERGMRNAGRHRTVEVVLGEHTTAIEVAMERAGLPAGPVAKIEIELSEDGGSTWRNMGGATLDGGESFKRDGTPSTESSYRCAFAGHKGEPIPFAPTDRVRATVTLLKRVRAHVEVRALS